MSKFNKGDKVRAVRDTSNWSGDQPLTAGAEHTVRGDSGLEPEEDGYDIELDNYSFYRSSDFALAQPEVRVGEKIKATRTYPNGDIDVHTGVVVYVNETQVETHNRALWGTHWIIEVIERAMDPLPTQTGSLILATVHGVENAELVLRENGWSTLLNAMDVLPGTITAWVPAEVKPKTD